MSFFAKFLPYLMVFQSGATSNESSNEKPSKIPFKTKFKLLGWLFGNPLEKFDILITSSSTSDSTSASSSTEIPWPTDQNVMQNWMYLVDLRRDSLHVTDGFYASVTSDIVDNLIAFWKKYSSKELR